MNIQVRPVQEGAKFFPFNVTMSRNSTLAQFKKEVEQWWNLQPKQQLVYYKGDKLKDNERTLISLQITNNVTIYVGLAIATICLFIRPIDPRDRPRRFESDLNWTVRELKNEVLKGTRVSGHSQVNLRFRGIDLEDNTPLRSVEELHDESELVIGVREVGC